MHGTKLTLRVTFLFATGPRPMQQYDIIIDTSIPLFVFLLLFLLDSYLGLNQPRLEGDEYLQVVDEFVAAVKARWPKVLIQVGGNG